MATLYVGSTEIYTTLTAAIGAAQNGDTIVLKENISESTLTIDGKDIAIDLGGFTFTGKSYIKNGADVVISNGKMTVAGNSPAFNDAVIKVMDGEVEVGGVKTVVPTSLELNGVEVDGGEAVNSRYYTNAVTYDATGGLKVTDCTITAGTATRNADCENIGSNSSTATGIYAPNKSGGKIEITNSTVTGGYGKTDAEWTGYVSYLFSPGGSAISLHGTSEVTITNSTITGGGSNWYNAEVAINVSNQFSGTLDVTDSAVTGGKAEGQVGNYGQGGAGIYTNMSTSCESIDITGSTITGGAGGKSSNAFGIEYRNEDIKMNITDSTVAAGNGENASGGGAAIGIYNSDSTQVVLDNVKLNGEGNGSNTVIKGGDKGITVVGPVEVTGGELTNTVVNVDASGLNGSEAIISGATGDGVDVNVTGNEDAVVIVDGGKTYITTETDPTAADTSIIYVNNNWAGQADNALVGVGKFMGVNAFADVNAAEAVAEAGAEKMVIEAGAEVVYTKDQYYFLNTDPNEGGENNAFDNVVDASKTYDLEVNGTLKAYQVLINNAVTNVSKTGKLVAAGEALRIMGGTITVEGNRAENAGVPAEIYTGRWGGGVSAGADTQIQGGYFMINQEAVASFSDTVILVHAGAFNVDNANADFSNTYIYLGDGGGYGAVNVSFTNGAEVTFADNTTMVYDKTYTVTPAMNITVDGTSTLTMDATSSITATTLTVVDGGKFIIDATGFEGFKKVVDLSGDTSLEGKVEITGEGVGAVYGTDGDITLVKVDTTTLYVNSAYTGEFGADLGDGKYLGVNAFASMDDAVNALKDNNTTIVMLSDATMAADPGFKLNVISGDGNKHTLKVDSVIDVDAEFAKEIDIDSALFMAYYNNHTIVVNGDLKGGFYNYTGSLTFNNSKITDSYDNSNIGGVVNINGDGSWTMGNAQADNLKFINVGRNDWLGQGILNLNDTVVKAIQFNIDSSSATAKSQINAVNSTIATVLNDGMFGDLVVGTNGEVNLTDSNLIVVGALNNNGTVNVTGESTMKIDNLTGNGIILDDATLTADSNIGGTAATKVYGTSVIKGTVGTVYANWTGTKENDIYTGYTTDKVALTLDGATTGNVYVGSDTESYGAELTVSGGSTVGGIYCRVYGSANITGSDNVINYINAKGTVTVKDAKVTEIEAMVAEGATVNIIDSDIDIAIGSNNNIQLDEGTTMEISGSTVDIQQLSIDATSALKLTKSTFTVDDVYDEVNLITNNGSITIDGFSTLTADSITFGENATITIDADGFSGTKKVIDLAGTSSLEGKVTLVNGEGITAVYGADGDVTITDQVTDTIYVNSAWAGNNVGATVGAGYLYGFNAASSMSEVAGMIKTDGSDTTIKFESDIEVAGDVVFEYGTGDITFTADSAVTVKQNSNACGFYFMTNQLSSDKRTDLYIGENVTFQLSDNVSDFAVWYGANLHVDGAITGGANWGSLYIFYGDHTVSGTGTVSTGRVQIGFADFTVNGDAASDRTDAHIDTNYLLVEESVFTANNAIIEAGAVHDSNNGSLRYGASEFYIKDSVFTADSVTLKHADSKFNVAGESTINIGTLTGNAIEVTSGGLKDSTIGTADNTTGNVIFSGNSALEGTNKLAGVNKVVNGSTLTIDKDAEVTAHYLMAGEDNYFAFGNDKEVKGGTIDIEGKLNITQNLNANANGVVNITEGAEVKAAIVAVENGEIADAAKAGVLNVDGKLQSTFLNVFSGGEANINGYVQLGEHETDQQLLQLGADSTVNVAGELNIKGSGTVNGTLNVNGGDLIVEKTLTNNGSVTVSGESTVNIGTLTGDYDYVKFEDATIIGDSAVGGNIRTYGNFVLAGSLTVKQTNMYGTATVKNGAVFNGSTTIVGGGSKFTLENGGTINSRFFNVVGGTADINGAINLLHSDPRQKLLQLHKDGVANLNAGGVVTIDGHNAIVNAGGTLNVAGGTLDITTWEQYANDPARGGILFNDGLTNVTGGTLNATKRIDNAGTFTVSGGLVEAAALNNSGKVTVSGGLVDVDSIVNDGKVVISKESSWDAEITGNAAEVAAKAVINGALTADLVLKGNITLNADFSGIISGKKVVTITEDKLVNIAEGSAIASLVVANGVEFAAGESINGVAEIKGAAKNAVITIADELLAGNKFSNGKLAVIDADDLIKVNTALANIASINGFAVENAGGFYYYVADGVTKVLSKVDEGIKIADSTSGEAAIDNVGNLNIKGDSDALADTVVEMAKGNTTITVASGKTVKNGGIDLMEFAIGSVTKNENGGKNNFNFGNYSDVDINGDIEALGSLTVGKNSFLDVEGTVFGSNVRQSISIGANSNADFAAINFDAQAGAADNDVFTVNGGATVTTGAISGLDNLKLANGKANAKTVMEINGDYTAPAANNSITLGNYAKLTINGKIDNGSDTSTGTTIKAGNYADIKVIGEVNGLAGLTLGKESTFKAASINGTEKANKINLGAGAEVETGAIDLKDGKNSITLGKGADLTATSISNAMTINVGSNEAYLNVLDAIDGVQKLTVGKGGWLDAASISGTDGNDTFNFGNESWSGESYAKIALDFGEGKNTLSIGNKAQGYFADTTFGTGNDTVKIGNDSIVTFGKLDMGEADKDKDTLTIGKNAKVYVDELAGVETLNATKGAEIWFSGDVADLTDVKGNWKDATIYDMEGELDMVNANTGSITYANEWDVYTFTDTKNGILTLVGADVEFQYSLNGTDWYIDDTIAYSAYSDLMIRVKETDETKGYSFSATLA